MQNILGAERATQLHDLIARAVLIVFVPAVEIVAMARMHVGAQSRRGTDVRMRGIERHQQNAEVQ